jgi:hypothetical protein
MRPVQRGTDDASFVLMQIPMLSIPGKIFLMKSSYIPMEILLLMVVTAHATASMSMSIALVSAHAKMRP